MRCIFIFMSRKWRKRGSAWKTNSPGACLCAASSSESLEAERGGFSFLKADMVGTWHSSNAYPRLGAAYADNPPPRSSAVETQQPSLQPMALLAVASGPGQS